MNAFNDVCPHRKHMLCMWHLRVRVEVHACKELGRVKNTNGMRWITSDSATEEMDLFNHCVDATRKDDFDKAHQKLDACVA